LFTDADCVPSPNWIRSLVEALQDPEVAAAKGTYSTEQRSWTARFVQAEYQSRYRIMRERKTIDFVDTYSAAYRKKVLEEAGGFDESFPVPSVEDQELSFRLAGQGAKMVFCPEAVVGHRHADNPAAYFRKKLKIGYWKMKVLARYPDRAVRDSHTPPSLKGEVASMAATLVSAPTGLIYGHWWLPLIFLALFAFFSFPFCASLWPERKGLVLQAPLFLVLRSLALGGGMVLGILGKPLRHRAEEKRMQKKETDSLPELESQPQHVEQNA
jgi:cellulose synthase/poly-beta-1,6-N-acetylglucosamine synthase-like glycosyltransferase